jgi:hypothetical protein
MSQGAGWVTVVPGVQQGSTNFLVAAQQVKYPNASVLERGWFLWLLTSIGMLFAVIPNDWNPRPLQYYFRFAIVIFFSLFHLYWVWFPSAARRGPAFQHEPWSFRTVL